MATKLGARTKPDGTTETVYRLSAPLLDCWPEWRNVVVQARPSGERTISRAWAYESADGAWRATPGGGSWVACFSPLSERDNAFAEREIAGAVS